MALIVKDRYAGEAAWKEWFEICSVAGCGAENAAKLRSEVEHAMFAQLARYGFAADEAGGDDPVAFFDGYFKLKGSRDKSKPLKSYFAYRIAADGLTMLNFVCGTLFGSGSGRIHDIVLDWIATLKGWKPRSRRGAGGNFGLWTASAVRQETGRWRRRTAWGIAAMLMVCCGIGGLWYEEVLRDRRTTEVMAKSARMAAYREKLLRETEQSEECALCDEAEGEEAPSDPKIEMLVDVDPIVSEPIAISASAPVTCKAASESVALIKSPITMRSMTGSRAPGVIGMMTRGGAAVCEVATVRPAASGERYAEARENEFANPKSEPLSTFGLDVDTSSYALMRSSLNELKRLPARGRGLWRRADRGRRHEGLSGTEAHAGR